MNAEKSRKQLNHPSIMAATSCFMEFRLIQNMRCAIRNVDSECLEVSIGIFVLHDEDYHASSSIATPLACGTILCKADAVEVRVRHYGQIT